MSLASAIHRAWRWSGRPAAARFTQALAHPGDVQRRLWSRLLRRHAATAYGRSLGVSERMTVSAWRQRVPLVDYADLVPWIDRIRAGEAQVLTPDRVQRLVPTGGSTGGIKLIPWTASLGDDFRRGITAWVEGLGRTHPAALDGAIYWSVSPPGTQTWPPTSVPIGFADDADYVGGWASHLVRRAFAVPSALSRCADIALFRHLTARCLLSSRELAMISVWHPSFLHLLLDDLHGQRDSLLRDLANGGPPPGLTPELKRCLAPWLQPQPRRAAELVACDWTDLSALWPRLALVSCWADGTSAPSALALRQRLGDIAVQPKGLLATEGMVSIPWPGGAPVLAVTSHVVEFMDAMGRAHWADEVVNGEVYEVALSTSGGLLRYRLGDLVRIEGFCGRTPRLRYLGRHGATSDLVGEKLHEGFVAACLAVTLPAGSTAVLAVNGDGAAGYTVLSEAMLSESVLAAIDRRLADNPQWRVARELGQLAPLRQQRLSSAALLRWRSGNGRTPLGAVKPPVLLRSDSHELSELLALSSGEPS